MSGLTTEAFGTITTFSDSYKVGLDDANTSTVKAVPKSATAKWTVQAVDDGPECYRLYVSDGKKDYALDAPDNQARVLTFEGTPISTKSHVWYISRFPDGYYYIQDLRTLRAWKLVGTAIKLVLLPAGNDGLDPFKFAFTFGG